MIIALIILLIVLMVVAGLSITMAAADADDDFDRTVQEFKRDDPRDDIETVIGLHGVDG